MFCSAFLLGRGDPWTFLPTCWIYVECLHTAAAVTWHYPFSSVEMTEEEQFALALKMSEQEARQVNCQEEEEEELLRKAIAESLNVSVLL